MTNILRLRFVDYLAKRNIRNASGFTLVELIVVVVIIGILSAIAVPSFNNASDKAKQKEASTLLASYAKAAQAYYTEYSQTPKTVANLNEYITVVACDSDKTNECKTKQTTSINGVQWNSPTGMYVIKMDAKESFTSFTATPRAGWNGYPVASVFCISTGSTILNEGTSKATGATASVPNCPD
tara:strand:- start:546 stop:1094 length:549 start_codon:yes stop_codon:yes gene_type:complete